MPVSRRSHLTRLGAVLAIGALGIAGCQGGTSTPTGSATAGGSGGASGGTLVVGMTSDPNTLYPWKATQFQAVNVLGLLYATLTELDGKLEVKPGIAEKWDTSSDGKTVTMTLRKGVKFADGSDLTSADVKYSLETIKDEKTAAVARATLASVTAVTAPDPQTVVLTLSAPDAALLAGLATVNLAVLKQGSTEAALNATPNGTGSFTLGERKPGQSIKLNANKGNWHAPKVDSVEFRITPDETSIVSGMQSGAIQFASLDDPLVAKTAQGSGITVTKTPQLSYHVLQLRATEAPLNDVNVRLAIQCGIDRQQVIDTAAGGEGTVIGPITSPAFLSDPAARPCPKRDVAKAKEYLAKSASPSGVKIRTIVSQGEYATSVNEAQSLKAQLAEVGVTLDLEVLESGAFVKKWVAADFQAAVALNGGRPDPDTMYGRYFVSTGNLNKVAGYSSPELDALFAKGKQMTDQTARKAVYAEVSKKLEDNAAWVWLFSGFGYTATTQAVKSYQPLPTGSLIGLRDATVK